MKPKLLIIFLATTSLTSFSQTGLLGSYPFNSNANDVSGNGNNGTVSGATLTTDRFGNPNSAYLFNGINSFINIGNNFSYGSHSFSCWARRDSVTGNMLVSKINNGPYDTKNSEYSINVFTIGTGTTWTGVNSTVSPLDYSQWNCYVATYNASNGKAKLYVNGMVDSVVVGSYFDVTNTPIYIGARPYWSGNGGPAFFFKGAIDEVNIYNRVLSQHEVDSLCPSLTTSIQKLNKETLTIFPNPAKNQINIKADVILIGSSYTVFDNLGKKVLTGKIISENTIVELENLSAGVYLLSIGDNLKQTFKVIKE